MNRKGFTLVELLATLVILGIVAGLSIYSISNIFSNAKEKTEDVFVGTIKDAMDIYLATDAKKLNFQNICSETLNKSYKDGVKVYYTTIQMADVINSSMKPVKQGDFVNPANEDVKCAEDVSIYIFKDEDHVYYYSMNKVDFECLLDDEGVITNLPKIEYDGIEDYFLCG